MALRRDVETYEQKCGRWARVTLGEDDATNMDERCKRFLEESLELVQSLGMLKTEMLALVNYVCNRPPGDTRQEVGGVMVTLGALCAAVEQPIDLELEAAIELQRCWDHSAEIAEKQKHKPKEIRG